MSFCRRRQRIISKRSAYRYFHDSIFSMSSKAHRCSIKLKRIRLLRGAAHAAKLKSVAKRSWTHLASEGRSTPSFRFCGKRTASSRYTSRGSAKQPQKVLCVLRVARWRKRSRWIASATSEFGSYVGRRTTDVPRTRGQVSLAATAPTLVHGGVHNERAAVNALRAHESCWQHR